MSTEMFPKSSASIRAAMIEAKEPTWNDWLSSRVYFLEYMGHPWREAEKIAHEEMEFLKGNDPEAPNV